MNQDQKRKGDRLERDVVMDSKEQSEFEALLRTAGQRGLESLLLQDSGNQEPGLGHILRAAFHKYSL